MGFGRGIVRSPYFFTTWGCINVPPAPESMRASRGFTAVSDSIVTAIFIDCFSFLSTVTSDMDMDMVGGADAGTDPPFKNPLPPSTPPSLPGLAGPGEPVSGRRWRWVLRQWVPAGS